MSTERVSSDDRLCPECKKPAVSEQGGFVVAFGQSFFHVDCFKCAKCGKQVNADTSLLLLSDGSPICTDCTYSCNVCQQPILDEAIMTGDDSYHAHCFRCKVCKTRIDDLVFAKTSQGIYCMRCHNERMVRIRNHVQKKEERERERRAGGSGSSKSREQEARKHHAGHHVNPRPEVHRTTSASSVSSNSRGNTRSPKPYVRDAFAPEPQSTSPLSRSSFPPQSASHSAQSFAVSVAPPEANEHQLSSTKSELLSELEKPNPVKQSTLPIADISLGAHEEPRRTYDDGVRPLNVLFGGKNDAPDSQRVALDGLTAPTSRHDKRHSINPALPLAEQHIPTNNQISQATLSPRSVSFPNQALPENTQSLTTRVRESLPLRASSPIQDQSFSDPPSSPSLTSPSGSRPGSLSQTSSEGHTSSAPTSTDHSEILTIDATSPCVPCVSSVPPQKARNKPGSTLYSKQGDVQLSTGTKESEALGAQRSSNNIPDTHGSRPSSGVSLGHHSQIGSRSVSPAHPTDVPHNVESETDTDQESEHQEHQPPKRGSNPPVPPPKEEKDSSLGLEATDELDASMLSLESGSEEMLESYPIEHTSRSTFIAPALPPIRISMSSADFSELFNSVGGFASRQSLDRLVKIAEGDGNGTLTPPPTAIDFDADVNNTPTPQDSFLPPKVEGDEVSDDTIKSEDEEVQTTDTPSDSPHMEDDRTITQTREPSPPLPPTKPHKFNDTFHRHNASSVSDASRTPKPPKTTAANLGASKTTRPSTSDSIPARITVTEPDSDDKTDISPSTSADLATIRLQEAITDARERGAYQLKMDRAFLEAILSTIETQKAEHQQLKRKFDGVKRTSKRYIEGLTVAQTEYDRELKARRDAEAEVTRLRVLLSGQVAKLTALSGAGRKEQLRHQLSKELHDNLSGLEQEFSNLKVQRDMTLAEVEELEATKSSTADAAPTNLGRSLTKRLDTLKSQYKRELVPLTSERESLRREIAELKSIRDVFLEETTVLNARNEDLAQLSAAYSRRMETTVDVPVTNGHYERGGSFDHYRAQPSYQQQSHFPQSISSSTSGSSTLHEDSTAELRPLRNHRQEQDHTPSKVKFMNWRSRTKEAISPSAVTDRKTSSEHNFQQLSILRFTRCDHCGDKMWGSQLRCTACPTSIHVRCAGNVHTHCSQQQPVVNIQAEHPSTPLPPSMFGRDLVEQVQADAKGGDRQVPVIVEKCIQAVDGIALDYEGIYRKTGGAGQSRMITHLFERGDYASFDLMDSERFNDICSVTSVLKNYFRSLPIPLLTYDLHEDFIAVVSQKDLNTRRSTMIEVLNRLPDEHYYTVRLLMLHLHRIHELSDVNKMTARNLGVIFGPTLMRSSDPGAEFNDMAGKALTIEWLVENALSVFGH